MCVCFCITLPHKLYSILTALYIVPYFIAVRNRGSGRQLPGSGSKEPEVQGTGSPRTAFLPSSEGEKGGIKLIITTYHPSHFLTIYTYSGQITSFLLSNNNKHLVVASHRIGMGMIAPSMDYNITVALKAGASWYLSLIQDRPGLIQTSTHFDQTSVFFFEQVNNYTIRIKSTAGYIGK